MKDVYKNKKVFITGHTGFKGSWLTSILLRFGAIVEGFSLPKIDNDILHYDFLVKRKQFNSKFKSHYGDIRNKDFLEKKLKKFNPDIIFHLAAQPLVRMSYEKPSFTYETNVIGTMNLLNSARKCSKLKSIIIVTTDKVYENKENLTPYVESDRLGGHDIYSSSKACAEILTESFKNSFFNLSNYKKNHNVLISTVRAGNVLGGGDWSKDRLIPDIVKSANIKKKCKIRSPNSIRPWQHVLDCLNGYLILGDKLLKKNKSYSASWNFSPNYKEIVSVEKMIKLSCKIWPDISVEYEEDNSKYESKILLLDSTKSNNFLNWKTKYDTKKTIEKTINWYKSYYLNNKILTFEQIDEFFDL